MCQHCSVKLPDGAMLNCEVSSLQRGLRICRSLAEDLVAAIERAQTQDGKKLSYDEIKRQGNLIVEVVRSTLLDIEMEKSLDEIRLVVEN